MIRVSVLCDSVSTVKQSELFFRKVLGFRHQANQSVGPTHKWFGSGLFEKSVGDGNVVVDFFSVGWLEKLRKDINKLPQVTRIVGLSVSKKFAHSTPQSPKRVGSSSVFLQPFAWLQIPQVYPLLFVEEEENVRSIEKTAVNHIKEIVFGETDNRLRETSAFFSNISTCNVSPGVISMSGKYAGEIPPLYENIIPAIRTRPSQNSTLVVKINNLDDIRKKIEKQYGSDIDCLEIGKSGQFRLEGQFFNGSDIRLTQDEKFEPSFVEAPFIQSGAVEFDRDDMGTMSCSSVSGMEIKERLYRLPKRIIENWSNQSRPTH